MKLHTLAMLLMLALAGCANEAPGSPTSKEAQTSSSTMQPAINETPEPAMPVELHNDTYAYPGPTDPPITEEFTVPSGVQWLNFELHAWADCPAFAGAEEPAITFTSEAGTEVVIDSFGDNNGFTFSGQCSQAGTTQEWLGMNAADVRAEAGSWSIQSQGHFTGDIRIVIVGRFG